MTLVRTTPDDTGPVTPPGTGDQSDNPGQTVDEHGTIASTAPDEHPLADNEPMSATASEYQAHVAAIKAAEKKSEATGPAVE